jgi:hypothetical protein
MLLNLKKAYLLRFNIIFIIKISFVNLNYIFNTHG